MASIVVSGDTSGTVTISAPAVAGTTTLTLPSTSGTVLTTASSTGISGSAISSGTVAEAYGGTGTNTGYYGFKNRIINGAMVIDQRNAGASITIPDSSFAVDRFIYVASQASKFTAGQNLNSITAPAGFTNYLGFQTLSSVSIGAGDYFAVSQKIEGFNSADLNWGTANAQSVTLSFRVYSSLTGTFGGSLRNSAANYSYPFSYSIPVANTWTTISITIAGPTAGTWIAATNGVGLSVNFGLGVGSTYSGTAGAWASANNLSTTGAVSVVGTGSATWFITGVQLEKGSTATSFDYRPYGTELALCQRYYQKSYNIDVAPGTVTNPGMALTRVAGLDTFIPGISQRLPVVMRATATVTWYSNGSGASGKVQSSGADVTVSGNYDGGASTTGQIQIATPTSAGAQVNGHFTASAEL